MNTPSPTLIVAAMAVVAGCGDPSASPQPSAADAAAGISDNDGGEAGPDADQVDDSPLTDGAAPAAATGPLAALWRMEDARRLSAPVVDQMLESPDVTVRRRTLKALGRVGQAEALGPLRAALTSSDAQTRRQALWSLGLLEPAAHDDVQRILLSFLELSPRPADRREAIESLGRVGSGEAAIGAMLAALEAAEPRLRETAARALGLMASRGEPLTQPALVALASHLSDQDTEVRAAAAFALSRSREVPAEVAGALTAPLVQRLRGEEEAENVRIMAARALGTLGGGVGALMGALEQDEDWRVRAAAAAAIGCQASARQRSRALGLAWKRLAEDRSRLLGPDLHPLVALLDEATERPSAALGPALRKVRQQASKLREDAEERPPRLALAHLECAAALAQDAARGRAARVRQCAEADPPLITPVERDLLAVAALRRSTVPGALNQLKRLLGHDDERVRRAAVEATGSTFTPLRLLLLEHALLDGSPQVVAAAAFKLAAAADHYDSTVVRPAEKLSVTTHSKEGPVTITREEAEVKKGRDPPMKALLKALTKVDADADVETAMGLIRATGALKARKAADAVRPFAGHHNQTIRQEARTALEALELDPGPEIRPDPPNLVDPDELLALADEHPLVTVSTTKGDFVISLRPDLAPATVANFLELADRGLYDGVAFHRVVPGFVAQTGDPSGTGSGGPGYTIRCEVNDARYERGTVGMALAGPDTGGSQFFITYSPQPHLDRRYTIFGHVTKGMEVVDALQRWDHITTIARQ